jgi:hypothetical protein
MESLRRFVANEPLSSVHEAVLGVLALKVEPVAPREEEANPEEE